jgi:hypothetical protein
LSAGTASASLAIVSFSDVQSFNMSPCSDGAAAAGACANAGAAKARSEQARIDIPIACFTESLLESDG